MHQSSSHEIAQPVVANMVAVGRYVHDSGRPVEEDVMPIEEVVGERAGQPRLITGQLVLMIV